MIDVLTMLWSYLKRCWKYVAAGVGALVAYLIYRRFDANNGATLATSTNEIEAREIEAARDHERTAREKNEKVLQATLEAVQKKYDEAQQQLDTANRQEVERIVVESAGDPLVLAKRISAVTGFAIILPEDVK